MGKLEVSELGDLCVLQYDVPGVRLGIELHGRAEGMMVDVRANNAGELSIGYPYGPEGDLYRKWEPPAEVQVAVREMVQRAVTPHIGERGIDKRALADAIGLGGTMGT